MFGGLFGSKAAAAPAQNTPAKQAPAAAPAAGGKANGKVHKPKAPATESSDSTIVKLDENGNPIEEEEEEEEPLYEPDQMHVYGQDGGALHPDDRQNPNPARQAEKEETKKNLLELAPKERKERHSADVKSNVSRQQGQKKNGHGGGYTWTGADDNDMPEGYVPTNATDKIAGVQGGAQKKSMINNQNQDSFNLQKSGSKDFPALGANKNAPPKSPLKQHQENAWKQAVADDPQITV